MSPKCFLKYFAIAFGVQIGLLALSLFVYYLGAFLYVYWPWMQLVEYLTGENGGHAMAGTAIVGWLIGMTFYSSLVGIVTCYVRQGQRTRQTIR